MPPENEKQKEKFANSMGFQKCKTTVIKDMSFNDTETNDTFFIPMGLKEFLKEHIEERDCYWESTGEEWYEDVDDLIDYFEREFGTLKMDLKEQGIT